MFLLNVEDLDINEKLLNLGEYFLTWKRKNMLRNDGIENSKEEKSIESTKDENKKEESYENKIFYVTLKQSLPEISIEKFPLFVETIIPACGTLDGNFTIVNKIKNNSKKLLNLECSVEDNTFFSIGGNKLVNNFF